jgi:hypothetical protein
MENKMSDEDKKLVETNPKTLHGQSSIPLSLFSSLGTAYGSLGKLNGKLKYGLSNFVATPVVASIYVDAIRRHLDKWMAGQENDSVDGVPHFAAILANVDILLCARAAGTLEDDRPLIKGYLEEMDKLTPIASRNKMAQSKARSFKEAWVNIGIGYLVNFLANMIVFPMFNYHVSLHDNLIIGVIYTFISLGRQYVIRRWFSKGD